MTDNSRNRQFPVKLPLNYDLLAIAYGVGRDDYLATVLGFRPDEGKFVTWVANFSFGPQTQDGEVACFHGHYFDCRDLASMEAAKGLTGEKAEIVIRRKTFERAWADFCERAALRIFSSGVV